MDVRLRIDELVLDGFPPGDRYRIAAALQGELARRLAAPGALLPRESGSAPRLDAGSFAVGVGAKPEAIGAQVARALYGGLRR